MIYGYLNSPFVSNPFSDAAIPPISLTSPVISGSGMVGQTLSTTDGTWSGTLPITYTYQWNRNGSEILGATFNTYTLVTADASTSIDCTVTATNAGGSLSKNSNAISVAAAGDADANAFIAAAAITDTTQKAAIEMLVVDLKGYGIWSKMKALYPMVGGTASQHKFNLKNPLDTDAAFRLVFNGGWTHSSTGSTPNGVNAWADTKLIPSTILTNNNYHLSNYSRTQITSTNSVDIGCSGGSNYMVGLTQYYNVPTLKKVFVAGDYDFAFISSADTDTLGFQIGTRTSQTIAKMFMDGAQSGSTYTASNPSPLPIRSVSISANNSNNAGGAIEFSPRQQAFASIGDGLTDTEAANYYTAVQTFQTTLSRNV